MKTAWHHLTPVLVLHNSKHIPLVLFFFTLRFPQIVETYSNVIIVETILYSICLECVYFHMLRGNNSLSWNKATIIGEIVRLDSPSIRHSRVSETSEVVRNVISDNNYQIICVNTYYKYTYIYIYVFHHTILVYLDVAHLAHPKNLNQAHHHQTRLAVALNRTSRRTSRTAAGILSTAGPVRSIMSMGKFRDRNFRKDIYI